MIKQQTLKINTRPKSLTNITAKINQLIDIQCGLCNVFVNHTSSSLIISENCDPDVLFDLESFMAKIVSEDETYRHHLEGPDDMPAHIRTVLTQTSITIPIQNSQLSLGRWQAVYLWEHRQHEHMRDLMISVYE